MVKIYRKEGWILNPKDSVANSILQRCESNDGICPCKHPENDGDLHCPCESYRLRDKCYCSLYIKENGNMDN